MNQENLEERVKPSRIKRIAGIAALALAVLGGAYTIFNNPEPTAVVSSAAPEPNSKEDSKEEDNYICFFFSL